VAEFESYVRDALSIAPAELQRREAVGREQPLVADSSPPPTSAAEQSSLNVGFTAAKSRDQTRTPDPLQPLTKHQERTLI
jgi:hypothetical protein